MKASRVSRDELGQAARTAGYTDLESVQAIVLENDGTISVLTHTPTSPTSKSTLN